MNDIYIGLISGTSVDGIDAVVIDFGANSNSQHESKSKPKLLAKTCYPIEADIKQQIIQLCDEKLRQGEINTMASLDVALGKLFAKAALEVCSQAGLKPQDIKAIGHHGQTIRHCPYGNKSPQGKSLDGKSTQSAGFTLQIADANTLAIEAGIPVVADFRRKDIALGGQGAPIVPAFHRAAFRCQSTHRFIVNIGGIANLTYLPPTNTSNQVLGYDTGPGNTLLDKWAMQHIHQPFDDNGQWASTGKVIKPLLTQLLTHPYFDLPTPKSTGREDFNRSWLNHFLDDNFKSEDVQATLVHLTAQTIATQIKQISKSNGSVKNEHANNDLAGEVYICGGGASNSYLLAQLTAQLPKYKVATTSELGINPDWVEAIAFAWLAKAYIEKIPGNIPSVTGASRETILGGMYLP